MIWRIASRNLFRRKKRTIVTAMSVALGIWLAVLAIGTREYGYSRLMAIGAQLGMGNLSLGGEKFLKNDYQNLIQNSKATMAKLNSIPEVQATYPRLLGEAYVATAHGDAGVGFIAVSPQHEKPEHNIMMNKMVEGRLVQEGDTLEANIGSPLAKRLNIGLGDDAIFTANDYKGEVISLSVKITGIFKTHTQTTDTSIIVLPIKRLRQDLNFPGDTSLFLAIYTHKISQIDPLLATLKNDHPPAIGRYFHWRETLPDMASFVTVDRIGYYALIIVVGLVVASGIFSCMIMNVMERRKEIATMMAVGLSPMGLMLSIAIESAMISIMGTLLGLLLVGPFYYYLHYIGIDMTPILSDQVSLGGIGVGQYLVKADITQRSFVVILVLGSLLATIAALGPALKAARTSPADALSLD